MNRLKELLEKKAKNEALSVEETKELVQLEAEVKATEAKEAEAKAKEAKAKEDDVTEIILSDEALEKITKSVGDGLTKKVDEAIAKAIEKVEPVVNKGVGAPATIVQVKDEIETMPKELRFFKGLKALMTDDQATLKQYNKYAIEKSGYQNETTDADGGYLVDRDFVAEVARLESVYGVAARDARVVTIQSNSLVLNKKTGGVTMYETGELVAKTGTKMTFGQDIVNLRKFAGIAIVTDELNEDAAVNIFSELTQDFALESARLLDTLVFTDPTTGLYFTSGTAAVSMGAALSDLDFDDINTAIFTIPQQAMIGAKFYLHRTLLGLIQRIKDNDDNYIWKPGVDGAATGTIWGYPYELVEVLNDINTVGDSNEPFIIFGNLRYCTLIRKAGLNLTTLTEATVHDSGSNAVNLAEQNAKALRAEFRANHVVQFPEAICLIGTGTVS